MKRITTLFLLVLTAFSILPVATGSVQTVEARNYRTSSSDVYVKGYYRKNGTYVAPYYRTKVNKTKLDNYSCIDYGRCK